MLVRESSISHAVCQHMCCHIWADVKAWAKEIGDGLIRAAISLCFIGLYNVTSFCSTYTAALQLCTQWCLHSKLVKCMVFLSMQFKHTVYSNLDIKRVYWDWTLKKPCQHQTQISIGRASQGTEMSFKSGYCTLPNVPQPLTNTLITIPTFFSLKYCFPTI